jgi:hypothetical protein
MSCEERIKKWATVDYEYQQIQNQVKQKILELYPTRELFFENEEKIRELLAQVNFFLTEDEEEESEEEEEESEEEEEESEEEES